MTNQEKIKYLKQYKYLDLKINNLLDEKERWKTKAEKVTSTISDMPNGNDGENQRENAMCMMIDIDKEINNTIDKYYDLGKEIKKSIENIEGDELKVLLTGRYIIGRTFEQIAVDMNYTWRWIHKLHSKALERLSI
jgi:predicted transcriptional regulator